MCAPCLSPPRRRSRRIRRAAGSGWVPNTEPPCSPCSSARPDRRLHPESRSSRGQLRMLFARLLRCQTDPRDGRSGSDHQERRSHGNTSPEQRCSGSRAEAPLWQRFSPHGSQNGALPDRRGARDADRRRRPRSPPARRPRAERAEARALRHAPDRELHSGSEPGRDSLLSPENDTHEIRSRHLGAEGRRVANRK